jgi:hypothetical protein
MKLAASESDATPASQPIDEVLAGAATTWPKLVALALVFDYAVSLAIQASARLGDSPLRRWAPKFLQEESAHQAAATLWKRDLEAVAGSRRSLHRYIRELVPLAERWLKELPGMQPLWELPGKETGAEPIQARWACHLLYLGLPAEGRGH